MRIGLVQMSAGQVESGNGGHFDHYARAAVAAGCAVVVFPELSDSGYDLRPDARPHTGMEETLAAVARSHRIWVLAGVGQEQSARVYNTLQVFAPDGCLVSTYRKMHLFGAGPVDEARHFVPGRQPAMAAVAEISMGLAICFDLRFPALYRAYALGGAEVLVTVAAWPAARIADWRLLQQARALENQAFTIGVNYCGSRAGLRFGGHSLCCGPDGQILAEADESQEGLIPCALDPERVRKLRADFPILKPGYGEDAVGGQERG